MGSRSDPRMVVSLPDKVVVPADSVRRAGEVGHFIAKPAHRRELPDYPFPDPSGSVFRPGGNFPACQSPLQGGPLLDRQRVKGEMVEAFREKGLRLLEKSVFRKAFSSGDEVHRDGPGKMIPYELQKTYRLENVHRTA